MSICFFPPKLHWWLRAWREIMPSRTMPWYFGKSPMQLFCSKNSNNFTLSISTHQHASFCPLSAFSHFIDLHMFFNYETEVETRAELRFPLPFLSFPKNVSLCDWSKILRKCQFWSPLGTHCRRTIRVTGTMLVSFESCTFLVFKCNDS